MQERRPAAIEKAARVSNRDRAGSTAMAIDAISRCDWSRGGLETQTLDGPCRRRYQCQQSKDSTPDIPRLDTTARGDGLEERQGERAGRSLKCSPPRCL
jgi:hypothetical protein